MEFQKQGAPWIKDVLTNVNTFVNRMEELLKGEAELEGQPELANEDFLYERFVDNRASGMHIGNWTIFKFFALKLKIKIAKEVIGEWLYTEHDVEMYRYFHNLNVDINTRCQPRYLKFKFGVDLKLDSIYYDNKLYATACFHCLGGTSVYLWFFNNVFNCYENLINKVKMRTVDNDADLFDAERYCMLDFRRAETINYDKEYDIFCKEYPLDNFDFSDPQVQDALRDVLIDISKMKK